MNPLESAQGTLDRLILVDLQQRVNQKRIFLARSRSALLKSDFDSGYAITEVEDSLREATSSHRLLMYHNEYQVRLQKGMKERRYNFSVVNCQKAPYRPHDNKYFNCESPLKCTLHSSMNCKLPNIIKVQKIRLKIFYLQSLCPCQFPVIICTCHRECFYM